MANTHNVQSAVKNAVADAREGDFQGLKQNVGVVARQAGKVVGKELGKARRTVTQAADQVEKSAREHPFAAAGVMFGAGALIGALVHAVVWPVPSTSQVIARALKNSAAAARDSFKVGLRNVRRAAH